MQSLINSLTQQQLNVVISMVDLDCLDYFPTIEQLVLAVEMFGYSQQDIIDAINSTNQFVFEDDDFECNCNQYEIDSAEIQLWNDLFIHSIDPQVGF